MPNFKYVFQFTQPDSVWSEVYYRTASDLLAASVISPSMKVSLCQTKCSLTKLRKVRISDVVANRNTVTVALGNLPGHIGGNPDVVGTAAKVILVAPTIGGSRKLWLRGLTDDAVARSVDGGTDLPSANLRDAIIALCNRLSIDGYTVRALTKIGPGNLSYPIVSITPISPGITKLTLNVAPGWPVPSSVSVSRVNQKLWPGLKGTFTLLSILGADITVGYTGPNPGVAVPTSPGQVRLVTYQYGQIAGDPTSGFDSFGSRATKKVSAGTRGAKRGARGLRLASAQKATP